VDPEDNSGAIRPYSFSYKALSVIAILILIFGGGWAVVGPGGGLETGTDRMRLELDAQGRQLEASTLEGLSEEEAGQTAQNLVDSSRMGGIDPRESLATAFPKPRAILAMLSLDRDVDDYLEYADRDDAAGDYYREEADLAHLMRPLRSRYEAAFSSAYYALSGRAKEEAGKSAPVSLAASGRKRPYIASADDVWLPPRNELRFSHPYALDVFFFHVDRSGEAERGPVIRALYPGVVVASASDWTGGQGVATWKSGGLSPASGNGLVIYDPATRRYCSYFHLSALYLRTGDTVEAGQSLGRGGNSGINARKKGHGEHVHVEIFDCGRGAPFSAQEILDLLKS
jgi:murein DD-endopeptidase MepM/ murein hydrolase activator NlpD